MSYKGGVYFILDRDSNALKIGKANVVETRLGDLQIGNPNKLTVINFIPCKNESHSKKLERQLHNKYDDYHIRGEWFKYHEHVFEELFDKVFSLETKQKRAPLTRITLWGEENYFGHDTPKCFFYKELDAQVLDNYESASRLSMPYRTMEYDTDGKQMLGRWSNETDRVFISDRKHKENLKEKRFKERKEINRLVEISKSTESSLENFMETLEPS